MLPGGAEAHLRNFERPTSPAFCRKQPSPKFTPASKDVTLCLCKQRTDALGYQPPLPENEVLSRDEGGQAGGCRGGTGGKRRGDRGAERQGPGREGVVGQQQQRAVAHK
jgi:hypothetical protein